MTFPSILRESFLFKKKQETSRKVTGKLVRDEYWMSAELTAVARDAMLALAESVPPDPIDLSVLVMFWCPWRTH